MNLKTILLTLGIFVMTANICFAEGQQKCFVVQDSAGMALTGVQAVLYGSKMDSLTMVVTDAKGELCIPQDKGVKWALVRHHDYRQQLIDCQTYDEGLILLSRQEHQMRELEVTARTAEEFLTHHLSDTDVGYGEVSFLL